ncbi:MAG: dihydrolipoamide succinyltransferase, partial [Gammaproteobacteria bacterium]
MTTKITVPSVGESITEATVAKWLKGEGDAVVQDEPIVELETDKVTVEVNAPVSGILQSIIAPAESDVEIGAVLGEIEEGALADETAPAATSEPETQEPEPEPE